MKDICSRILLSELPTATRRGSVAPTANVHHEDLISSFDVTKVLGSAVRQGNISVHRPGIDAERTATSVCMDEAFECIGNALETYCELQSALAVEPTSAPSPL